MIWHKAAALERLPGTVCPLPAAWDAGIFLLSCHAWLLGRLQSSGEAAGTAQALFRWALIHLDGQQLVKEIGATQVTADE